MAVQYTYQFKLKEYIKSYPGVRYSKTHLCFYIFNEPNYSKSFVNYLKEGGYSVQERAVAAPSPRQQRSPLPPLDDAKKAIYKDYLNFLYGKRFGKSTVSVYGGFVLDFFAIYG